MYLRVLQMETTSCVRGGFQEKESFNGVADRDARVFENGHVGAGKYLRAFLVVYFACAHLSTSVSLYIESFCSYESHI